MLRAVRQHHRQQQRGATTSATSAYIEEQHQHHLSSCNVSSKHRQRGELKITRDDDVSSIMTRRAVRASYFPCWCKIGLALSLGVALFYLGYLRLDDGGEVETLISVRPLLDHLMKSNRTGVASTEDGRELGIVPQELMRLNVYSPHDFVNEIGRIPPYWNTFNQSQGGGSTSMSPPLPGQPVHFGPCYAPKKLARKNWAREVAKNERDGPPFYHHTRIRGATQYDVAGYCRPGFIIIGAGKCGTRYA